MRPWKFLTLPGPQRAALLKALLMRGARWTEARDLILKILGPSDNRQHVRQKGQYPGYGAIDAQKVLDCASDRATLWAVGRLVKAGPYLRRPAAASNVRQAVAA